MKYTPLNCKLVPALMADTTGEKPPVVHIWAVCAFAVMDGTAAGKDFGL